VALMSKFATAQNVFSHLLFQVRKIRPYLSTRQRFR
jgi:hypothetical protein